MARITCEYCNTEYEMDMDQCPLCGMPNTVAGSIPEEPEPSRAKEPKKPPKEKRSGARAAPAEEIGRAHV